MRCLCPSFDSVLPSPSPFGETHQALYGQYRRPLLQLQCNISVNGYHEAIALQLDQEELVFDNLHPAGIPRIQWLKNFYSPMQDLGQDFKITESTF